VAANLIPAVLSLVPFAGWVVLPQPESSPVAGSEEPVPASPEAKRLVVPPMAAMVPVPVEGLIEPVAVLASGTTELKSQRVITV